MMRVAAASREASRVTKAPGNMLEAPVGDLGFGRSVPGPASLDEVSSDDVPLASEGAEDAAEPPDKIGKKKVKE